MPTCSTAPGTTPTTVPSVAGSHRMLDRPAARLTDRASDDTAKPARWAARGIGRAGRAAAGEGAGSQAARRVEGAGGRCAVGLLGTVQRISMCR